MFRSEIDEFFPFKLGCPVYKGGYSFRLPTLEWLQGPFYNYFKARLFDANVGTWKKQFQCRDFVSLYRILAVECWANTIEARSCEEDSLAIGEFWFLPKPDVPAEGHAICPCFTDKGLVYIDPQNNSIWSISDEQFQSRFFVRF